MSITSIYRDVVGSTALVRIITTDTLATVATSGYLTAQNDNITALNGGEWTWLPTDLVAVSASDGGNIFTINAAFTTLTAIPASGGGGGTVTPAQVQQSSFNYSIDSGTDGTNYLVALTPPANFGAQLLVIYMFPVHDNTIGNPTLDFGGGPVTITDMGGTPLALGDIINSTMAILLYNNGSVKLLNPQTFSPQAVQQSKFNYAVDTGPADGINYVAAFNPTITGLTDGLIIEVLPGASNSSSNLPVITVDGIGPTAITLANGRPVGINDIQVSIAMMLQYSVADVAFILLNPNVGASVEYNAVLGAFNSGALTNDGSDNYTAVSQDGSYPTLGFVQPGTFFFGWIVSGNAGASTFSLNGSTVHPILKLSLGSLVALSGGELVTGNIAILVLNSAANNWILINPA